jgi:hypothetical protein
MHRTIAMPVLLAAALAAGTPAVSADAAQARARGVSAHTSSVAKRCHWKGGRRPVRVCRARHLLSKQPYQRG